METLRIEYIFELDEAKQETFIIELDSVSLDLIQPQAETPPSWAKLDVNQCRHCPLNADDNEYCPVAALIPNIVSKFEHIISYEELVLEVKTPERTIKQHTTTQRAISSLFGLLFPVSGCPHTAFFKPMARFHLPLASDEETLFRATGMYLIAQYLITQQQQDADFSLTGLEKIYDNLHILNTDLASRLRSAVTGDSSANAIVLLDTFTSLVPYSIDENLDLIRDLFKDYF